LYRAALRHGGELQSLVLKTSGCSAQCIPITLLNRWRLSRDHKTNTQLSYLNENTYARKHVTGSPA